MPVSFIRAFLKSLSSLSINLSAIWLGSVFVIPNLSTKPLPLFSLTVNLIYGIIYLSIGIISPGSYL